MHDQLAALAPTQVILMYRASFTVTEWGTILSFLALAELSTTMVHSF